MKARPEASVYFMSGRPLLHEMNAPEREPELRDGNDIADELEARDWTPEELAARAGRPVGVVRELITGRRGLTPELAHALRRGFESISVERRPPVTATRF